MHAFINCVYDDGKQNRLQKEWICVLKFQNMKMKIAFI